MTLITPVPTGAPVYVQQLRIYYLTCKAILYHFIRNAMDKNKKKIKKCRRSNDPYAHENI